MVDTAIIKIWGKTVGAIRWDDQQQLASFQYDKRYIARGWDLSPIKMPLNNGDRIYSFPELRKAKDEVISTFKGLPGLLADVLPDKYGNQLINLWLAQNGRPVNSMNPVEQLCFIGSRGMGALEFEPAHMNAADSVNSIEIKSLVEIAQKMLSGRENFNVKLQNNEEEKALSEILKIGTSAGGARAKAVIAYNKETGEVKSGQANAPEGFEHWLLKLDGVTDAQFGESYGYGRVEYAYYLMAKDCEIDIMESELLEENGRAHFMTKRFDRDSNNVKHHVQTWCGIQHFDFKDMYSFSYEQLFQTMRVLRLTYPEAEQMFKRMVFNFMATNYDDHTKNFSFRLKQGGRWELSPAYDICYSYDPNNIWVNQLTLSINGKRKDINTEDFMTVARANNIKKAEQIIDQIQTVVKQWDMYATETNIRPDLATMIKRNLNVFKF